MRIDACPHCGTNRIITANVPRDVVVVVPCPECKEFVVLFRDKAAALSRSILEHGTKAERTAHLAEVIEAFIEPGMFSADASEPGAGRAELRRAGEPDDLLASAEETEALSDDDDEGLPEDLAPEPISQDELDRFVRTELKQIDNAKYFRRHFG
ncbi:MAG: hypothetical protein IT356_13150 [Gemmatimonadaceae bacterium]|nr:hypothetical protein [Gemmatimonadaceae bacterium]